MTAYCPKCGKTQPCTHIVRNIAVCKICGQELKISPEKVQVSKKNTRELKAQ